MAYIGEQVKSQQLSSPNCVNLLVNGGFEIWQRGNGAFTANGVLSADRWAIQINGTDAVSVSKDTANTDTNSAACAAVTVTHSNAESGILQKLEDFTQLRGLSVSLSVRVKASVAGTVRLLVQDGVSANVYSAFHPGDGTYHTLTATMNVASNASALLVLVLSSNTSCTFYADNAMLVVGSATVNYVPLTPADEMARCQRYYEVIAPNGSTALQRVGYGASTSGDGFPIRFVRKAGIPTVTKVGTFTVSNCSQPNFVGADVDVLFASTTVTTLGSFQWFASGGQYVTLESNP